MRAAGCGQEVADGCPCYEIRYGYLAQGEFLVDSDLCVVHQDCLPQQIQEECEAQCLKEGG